MIQTPVPVPELMSRLERLAQERHTDRDTLLSEAIAAYLEREETQNLLARIEDAYADDPDDIEAQSEMASLARSRRRLLRRADSMD